MTFTISPALYMRLARSRPKQETRTAFNQIYCILNKRKRIWLQLHQTR